MSYDEEMHFYVKRPFVGDFSGWCIKGMGAQLGLESTECLIKTDGSAPWKEGNWPHSIKSPDYGHSMICLSFTDKFTNAIIENNKMIVHKELFTRNFDDLSRMLACAEPTRTAAVVLRAGT